MSAVTGVSGTDSTTTTGTLTTGTSNLANEQTFLKLLVAQMQNQDPLNPMDSTQFVTQLAQYSSLEQLIGIKQDADQLTSSKTATATTTTTTTPTTTTPTTTTPTTTTPTTAAPTATSATQKI